ncbi:MAG: M23 family metallopeptidase [Flavobacteriales bacterium]|jgi:murein DD-endopeptidase MepM/ murein hydrolase activator NlpD|nr:MAG: M23 family metallopeptidase [Flavobacteriales bacterium]
MRLNALLTLLAGALISAPLRAQVDTSGYGGPDGVDIYDELVPADEAEDATVEISRAARALGILNDVNDSLSVIPGYDMYCHWNTEAIFDRGNTSRFTHDTLCLHLSVRDDDHALPCPGHLTSPFGPRKGRMHYGLDLKLQKGDPVVCAFPGMVRISKYNKTFGHVVVVRHHNGLETLYAHLSKRLVQPGQVIAAGDTLGLGGNTGRSYGSHLHFEVRFLDQPIDPALIFDVENGTLKARTFEINKDTFSAMAAAKAAAGARRYHVVRRGDTLSAIARRYGTSVSALCRMNGIRERSVLAIGQRVRYN